MCVAGGEHYLQKENTSDLESFALSDPDNGKTVTENKACGNLFAKTFSSKVERLVKQVGNKDAMVDEITEKFPNNSEVRSPQFETNNIINVIRKMKNSSSSGHDGFSMNYVQDCVVIFFARLR